MKYYLKYSIRNIFKNKSYSYIRICGLAIALAASILILMYVQHEFSYDRFHDNSENIYRLCTLQHPYHPPQTAGILAEGLPEISSYTRILPREEWIIKHGDKQFKEKELAFVDPNFFKIFSFNLLEGNPENVLENPYSIVITSDLAHKFFSNENPIGKLLKLRNNNDYIITGIMEEMPDNSHFQYRVFATLENSEDEFGKDWMNNWGWGNFLVYFKMTNHFLKEDVEAKCSTIMAQHRSPGPDNPDLKYTLQPLHEIHLLSYHFINDIQPQNSIINIFVFTAIGLLILLIACINYINLLIAQTSYRFIEIGIKKAFGVTKPQLFIQHLTESFITIILTFSISVVIVIVCFPYFNTLTGTSFSFATLSRVNLLLGFICLLLITTLLAGCYPAFVFSSYEPVRLIRKLSFNDKLKFSLSKFLVGVQFAIVILLLGCSLFMFRQVKFLENKELGYDKENILISALPDDLIDEKKFQVLKQSLLRQNEVLNVSATSCIPPDGLHNIGRFIPEGKNEWINMPIVHVRHDYFDILGLEASQGRLFSREMETDINEAVILNKSAIKKLSLNDNPVGQTIRCFWPESNRKIIGIINDFHFESLYESTKPAAFIIDNNESWQLMVKIAPSSLESSIKSINKICTTISPDWIFDFQLLDSRLEQIYRADKKTFLLMKYFTFFTMFIACMGLFGLASILTQNRIREVGIRKVNGATTQDILFLLNKKYVILVSIAFIVSVPFIWYIMKSWLANFAYKTGLSWWIFILTGIIALIIALLTVSWQTWKAANNDPVKVLRYE